MTTIVYTGPAEFFRETIGGHAVLARGRLSRINVADDAVPLLLARDDWSLPDDAPVASEHVAAPPGPRVAMAEPIVVPAHHYEIPADSERPDALMGRQRQARTHAQRWRSAWRPAPRLGLPGSGPITPSVVGGPKLNMAWVQWTGATNLVSDVLTANFHQHITVAPNQVLLVPFEVAVFLRARSAQWAVMTVDPHSLSPVHDSGSGLDTLYAASAGVWGINSGGQPYFDSEGALPHDGATLTVIAAVPYLNQ